MSVKIPDEVSMKFGDAKVVRVADARYHQAALLSDGRVVCWGYNRHGQCDVPADLGPCKAVAAGYSYTFALTEDGRVHVWGLAGWVDSVPAELVATMTDDAWIDFAVREYPRFREQLDRKHVFPERIRALPQFETIRAMHRLAGG
jgi:alpha-tubulin suppressor-like RCC1 family protein